MQPEYNNVYSVFERGISPQYLCKRLCPLRARFTQMEQLEEGSNGEFSTTPTTCTRPCARCHALMTTKKGNKRQFCDTCFRIVISEKFKAWHKDHAEEFRAIRVGSWQRAAERRANGQG